MIEAIKDLKAENNILKEVLKDISKGLTELCKTKQ
ncbi:MAG: hypothetical protein ACI86M_000275 [Saprospiraceae bacterium]|jgi:hypothetical protein